MIPARAWSNDGSNKLNILPKSPLNTRTAQGFQCLFSGKHKLRRFDCLLGAFRALTFTNDQLTVTKLKLGSSLVSNSKFKSTKSNEIKNKHCFEIGYRRIGIHNGCGEFLFLGRRASTP